MLRRFVDRTEPDDVHAKVFQVRDLGGDAIEVSPPITVRVAERGRVDLKGVSCVRGRSRSSRSHLIDDGLLPPLLLGPWDGYVAGLRDGSSHFFESVIGMLEGI